MDCWHWIGAIISGRWRGLEYFVLAKLVVWMLGALKYSSLDPITHANTFTWSQGFSNLFFLTNTSYLSMNCWLLTFHLFWGRGLEFFVLAKLVVWMLGSLKFSILDPIMHANAFLMFHNLFSTNLQELRTFRRTLLNKFAQSLPACILAIWFAITRPRWREACGQQPLWAWILWATSRLHCCSWAAKMNLAACAGSGMLDWPFLEFKWPLQHP